MSGLVQTLRLVGRTYADYSTERAHKPLHPALRQVRQVRWVLWISFAGLALYVMYARPAAAAFALFDPIVDSANQDSQTWFTAIQGLVRPTFLMLGTIELCWAAAIWAFEKDSLNSLAIEVIKKIMFHGFFYALLQYAPVWIPSIVNSFQTAGEAAIGTQTTLTTDSIIEMGLDVIGKIWTQTAAYEWSITAFDPEEVLGTANPVAYAFLALAGAQYVLAAITSIIVAFAYVIVAAQFFTLKVESYVLFAAGAIFLGMGSNSFTKDYVTKYLNYAINVGVRLLVLILILSLTLTAVNKMGIGSVFDPKALLGVMAAAVLQAILAIKAPDMAGALLNGSPGLTAGGVFNTALNTAAQFRLATGSVGGGAAAGGNHQGGSQQGGGHQGGPRQGGGGPNSLNDAVSAGHRPMSERPVREGAAETLRGLGSSGASLGRAPAPLSPGVPQRGAGGGTGGLGGAPGGPDDSPNWRGSSQAGGFSGTQSPNTTMAPSDPGSNLETLLDSPPMRSQPTPESGATPERMPPSALRRVLSPRGDASAPAARRVHFALPPGHATWNDSSGSNGSNQLDDSPPSQPPATATGPTDPALNSAAAPESSGSLPSEPLAPATGSRRRGSVARREFSDSEVPTDSSNVSDLSDIDTPPSPPPAVLPRASSRPSLPSSSDLAGPSRARPDSTRT
jgi:type IV secretion system protein TrbL